MTEDGVRVNSPRTMPTHFHGRPEEERALDAFIKLARCVASLGAYLGGPRGHLGTAGLTESQFGVLETLLHLGPLHQCQLAQKHLLSPGNLTLVINNLQRDGLVRRQRSTEDRRYVEVQLTDAGRALITELFPRHARAVSGVFATLSPAEQTELGRLCRKLGRHAAAGANKPFDAHRAGTQPCPGSSTSN